MFKNIIRSLLKQVLRLEGINYEQPNLIIFDEIQTLNDPSNLLKLLHDHFPALKIIATGSSSLQIKSKFSDSLAGRKHVYQLEPLSFDEFLLFRGEDRLRNLRQMHQMGELKISELAALISPFHSQFLSLFEEYLLYGGYPEVVLIKEQKEKLIKLDSIVSSYIQKDIREVANIENLSAYNHLLEYLAINAGAQFKLSSAQQVIGIASVTVKSYLNLLQETFIVDELRPFFTNKNKEISKTRKIFFKDTGVNNLLLKNFNPLKLRRDAGALYESYVFNALSRKKEVNSSLYFYRTQSKSEIDFITVKNAEYSLYEVKSGKNQRIPRAMMEFGKKYANSFTIKQQFVINQEYHMRKKGVEFLPAYLL
jgi:predicted AAA+ superfamily ATPase